MSNVISIDVIADVKKAVAGIDDVNKKLGGIGKSAKSGMSTFKGLFAFDALKAGAQSLTGFLKGAFDEAQESIKTGAQTVAVLKSTNNAAGLTAKGFGDLATSISNKTGIDDEQIQAGENMLATFTNVRNEVGAGNDIFTQATKIATDMSVATGTDAVKANLQLGKALNDPIKGVGALARVGVTFTDQQKEQIKTMVKAGDTAGAQKVILGELSKEFGGSAEAQATAADKAKVGWVNFKEGIGTALMPILNDLLTWFNVKIVPALQVFADWLTTNLPPAIEILKTKFNEVKTALQPAFDAIQAVIKFMRDNPETVKAFAITIGILATAVGIVTAAQWLWNVAMTANPIGLVIVAIALLVAAIVYVVTHLDKVKAVFSAVWNFIRSLTAAVWGKIKSTIVSVAGAIYSAVSSKFNQVKAFISRVLGAIRSTNQTIWNGIKSVISAVWNTIKSMVTARINAVKSLITSVWNAIKSVTSNTWNAVVNTIKNKVQAIKDRISGMKESIRNIFSNAGDLLRSAGRRIIDGLLSGLREAAHRVTDFLGTLTDKIPDWKGPAERDATLLTDAGRLIMQSLVDGFDDGESGVKKQLRGTTKMIASAFDDVSSPTITPTVSLDNARFDSGSLSGSRGGNTYQITIQAGVGDPVAIGKAVTQYINAYETSGGRKYA
jgi:phage-related protein